MPNRQSMDTKPTAFFISRVQESTIFMLSPTMPPIIGIPVFIAYFTARRDTPSYEAAASPCMDITPANIVKTIPIVQLATLRIRAAIPPSFILGERLERNTNTVIIRINGIINDVSTPPTPETSIAESC